MPVSSNWSLKDMEKNKIMTGSGNLEFRPFVKERPAIPTDLFNSELLDSSITRFNPLYGENNLEESQTNWEFIQEPIQECFSERSRVKDNLTALPTEEHNLPPIMPPTSDNNHSWNVMKKSRSSGSGNRWKDNGNNSPEQESNTSVHKSKRDLPILSRRPTLDNILEENEESTDIDDRRERSWDSSRLLTRVVNVLEGRPDWSSINDDNSKKEHIYSVPYDHVYAQTPKTGNNNCRKEHLSSVSSYDSVFSRDSKSEINSSKEPIYSVPTNNRVIDIHRTDKSSKLMDTNINDQQRPIHRYRQSSTESQRNWINASKRTVSFDEKIKNEMLSPNTIYSSKYTLKYLYDGKIVSKEAVAGLKLNPIFQDDVDIYQNYDDVQMDYYNPRFKLKRRLSNQGVYSIYNPRFSLGDIFEQELHYFRNSHLNQKQKQEITQERTTPVEKKDQEVQVESPGDFTIDLEGCDALIKKTLAQERRHRMITRSISAIVFILLLSLALGLGLGFGLSKSKQ